MRRGYYIISDAYKLYQYGKKMLHEKKYDVAKEFFEKSYGLNPENFSTCFQLFKENIIEERYEESLKYIDKLLLTNNPYYKTDINFYLYLLNFIIDIPDEYKSIVERLQFMDIRVDIGDKRFSDNKKSNKIRISAFNRKFTLASTQLSELVESNGYIIPQEVIIKKLLNAIKEKKYTNKIKFIDLIKNGDYETLISKLDTELSNGYNIKYSYMKLLATDILKIKQTGIVPQVVNRETSSIFDAIDDYNYELAIKLNNNNESEIGMLLTIICELIKNLKEEKNDKTESNEIIVEEIKTDTFSDVIYHLLKQDIESAFSSLDSYMTSIKKEEYKFFVIDLIKISLINNDMTFTAPITALALINRNELEYNISEYIENFYISISKSDFKQAHIYLDIVSNLSKLGYTNIPIENLEITLNMAENSKKTPVDVRNEIIEEKLDVSTADEEIKHIEIVETKQEIKTVSNGLSDKEIKYIENQCKKILENKGIILLEPMDSKKRYIVHKLLKEYKNIVSFSIGEDDCRQVVLRYITDKKMDIRELLRKGTEAYRSKKYELSIGYYLEALQCREPKAFIYANLGIQYTKIGKTKIAIDYLKVAQAVSKNESKQFDFEDFILNLQSNVDTNDRKKYFKMDENEFDDNLGNYYGIDSFEEINEYIINSKLDVTTACKEMGMTEEQINVMNLIYAREYYMQGDYEKGDEFFKSVVDAKAKTKLVIRLIEEIKNNRRFYINRVDEEHRVLTLSLKPKK